jgi:thiol-disulfide isomerase/thioredoxin
MVFAFFVKYVSASFTKAEDQMTRFFLLLTVFLAGCVPRLQLASQPPFATQTIPGSAGLPDYGPAPELTNTVWLNTRQPLRLADLRGKVVLLEMWTFGCSNCQHVTPTLKQWDQEYRQRGLVIIGNHFPEFPYEADLQNLKQALVDQGISYPVAQDNDGATWRAYHNRYWPTLYLIDQAGHIRYQHIGEGEYDATEAAIQRLLDQPTPQP